MDPRIEELYKQIAELGKTVSDLQNDPRFADLAKAIEDVQKNSQLIDHQHNGNDSTRVNFADIAQRKIWVHHSIQGSGAATAGNYGTFFTIPAKCYLNAVTEVHQNAGSDGGAVTLMIEKLASGVAPDSGVSTLTTALSLKTTANIPQSGVVTTTLANRNFVAGDRLCMKDAGVLTAVANVTVVAELIMI